MILGSLTIAISGCETAQPLELTEEISKNSFEIVTEIGHFLFELLPSEEKVFLIDINTYYDNDKLVIKGKVKRGYQLCCKRITGHVDI